MPCRLATAITRAQEDLARAQTGANLHDVNNRRLILQLTAARCADHRSSGRCSGPEKCQEMPILLREVDEVGAWILNQWRRRFRNQT